MASRDAPELTPQTDELIRERYGELNAQAATREAATWESGPRRRLALILLLDQFSRNIYRGSARASRRILQALSLTVSGHADRRRCHARPGRAVFFYMPLMHAESLDVQEESVAAFRRLARKRRPNCTASSKANLELG